MIFVGIDPGASGGIAWVEGSAVTFRSMPKTYREILHVYQTLDTDWVRVAMELVSGYIGVGQPGSSMFNFGANFGALEMGLVSLGVVDATDYHEKVSRGNHPPTFYKKVRPQAWQKALGIPSRKKTETKTAWKNRLKAEAEHIFPSLKPTLATADALLLAHYARVTYGGQP